MQTRSGRKLPLPKPPRLTVKKVRIPSQKRQASALDCPQIQQDAPPAKKRRLPKTVRFQHDGDCEYGVKHYQAPFPNDILISEKESSPSEELLRKMSTELDGFLAEPDEGDGVQVLIANEAEPCERDAQEDGHEVDDELVAEWEEGTIIPLIDDVHSQDEDQRPGTPRHDNDNPPPATQRETAVIDTTTSNPTPTNQKAKDRKYKQRYLNLKTTAWHWSTTYFSPSPSTSPSTQQPTLNLPSLCHTSPQLMEYANYISARTDTSSWEDLFNQQRVFLVYCILGKMIEVHVLGHEMFGAFEEELYMLRAADEEGVMDDGLLRQEQRADDISAFLGGSTDQQAPDNTVPPGFLTSLSELQASFLQMLSPLLSPQLTPEDSRKMKRQLSKILLAAATLSLSIRREPSTIYHWHTHPAPGTLYSSKTMHILDRDSVKEGDFWREATDLRVVTMAGWPSCVAYGPGNLQDGGGYMRVVGRAEVLVTWGAPVEPLAVRPTNWLGLSLRVDMGGRLEQRDKDERVAVVGSGLVIGATLAMGWAFQQSWVVDTMKGLVGL